MTERKYTESEIRRAVEKAYVQGNVQDAGPEFATVVLSRLTGPRLKPDCHVEDTKTGVAWHTLRTAEQNGQKGPFIALLRADRVMEWAREMDSIYFTVSKTIENSFARRIREETEVSDD